MFKNVFIVGLGLIGGSLASLIKQVFPQVVVTGVSHTPATVEYALSKGIIDHSGSIADLALAADLIIVCTPIDNVVEQVRQLYGLAKPEAIIIDVASTKQVICDQLQDLADKFIGGHPMAGKETKGIRNADAAIYQDAIFALTPVATSAKVDSLQKWLVSLGFRVQVTNPAAHDAAVAAISHFPYFNAATLVKLADNKLKAKMAATGFKSGTRTAASDPAWGLDLIKHNKPAILAELNKYQKHLTELRSCIENDDLAALQDYLEASVKRRKEIYPE